MQTTLNVCGLVLAAFVLSITGSPPPPPLKQQTDWRRNAVQDRHQQHPTHRPKYEFEYGVKDTKTGDIKSHWETRDGDKVKGGYSLREADGRTRIVEYTVDGQSGFRAVVRYVGEIDHPQAHKLRAHGKGHSSSYVSVKQDVETK